MTQNQIDRQRALLNRKYYGDNPHIAKYLVMPITTEDAILFEKLDIYEMMISNLAYGQDYFKMTTEDWYVRNLGKDGYDWDRLAKLSVKNAHKVVEDMWEEMKNDFNNYATVNHDTYVDPDGLSYNTVNWTK